MTVDVAVVGGGVIGCAVAREVTRSGASVLVLDRDRAPRGASWAAAGMLAPQAESSHGGVFLELLLRARDVFPALAAELLEETGISIEYRTEGMLLIALNDSDEAELERRFIWQTEAGLPVVRLTGADALAREPALSPEMHSALFFAGDHQVENRRLHRALSDSASRAGALFRDGDGVRALQETPTGVRLDLDSGDVIAAKTAVLAAGSWSGTIDGLPRPIPVTPIYGQLLSIATGDPPLMRHVVATPRGYLVPRADGRVIIGATAEDVGFRRDTTLAGLHALAGIGLDAAPALGAFPVEDQWSGLRPGTPDELPIIGRDPSLPALIYATGHYRNGILLAPITGKLVAQLVTGDDPDIDLFPYRPDRFASQRSADGSTSRGRSPDTR